MSDHDVADIKRALSDPTRVLEALGISVQTWRYVRGSPSDTRALWSLQTFAMKISLDGPNLIGTPCWVWLGSVDADGYGRFGSSRATRLVLECLYGPLGKMQACHRCDNPPCLRPSHLWIGTDLQNKADKLAKGRQATGLAITATRNHASGARHGRHTKPEATCRGERHPDAKLTEDLVREIRATAGVGSRALARNYGVSRNAIRQLLARKTWAHVKP